MKTFKLAGTFLLAGALALAGCSGETGPAGAAGPTGPSGSTGPTGPAGQDLVATAKPESCAVCHPDAGSVHQNKYNAYTDATTLQFTIDSVVTTGTQSVLNVSVSQSGQPVADVALIKSKTFYAGRYDAGTNSFVPSFSYGTWAAVAGQPGKFTVSTSATAATFAPESTDGAYVFGYVATGEPVVKAAYTLYPDVFDGAKIFTGSVAYESTANVEGCEGCHGKPYRKHGTIQPKVAGLNDFTSCKVCHYDTRTGGHQAWQLLADDPAAYAAQNGTPTADQKTKYAYKARIMNDVHMSHAMEFEYPQSMANCVTCHANKLDKVLTDANFQLATCKSCHPVKGTSAKAPALASLLSGATYNHSGIVANDGLYTWAGNCNDCHKAGGMAPTFAQIHAGYNKSIYTDGVAKFSDSVKAQVDSASFDAATNKLTVNASMVGTAAGALVKPTVVVSLYGYDTKDFLVSGHGSQADGKRNLEWTEGSTSNGARLTVSPDVATAGNTSWTLTADLSTWADKIASGAVKRVEVGFLPVVALDQTQAVSATNPAIAVAGVTATVDLAGNAIVPAAQVYGKAIVDSAKCNKCHAALGTTFHSPSYGSAGTVACRLCHVPGSGASHLEMQSRSIDSFVHAIHSMQAFDIKNVDFADPVQALEYDLKMEATYPAFTLLSCESCHNPGTYGVPDNSKSLPALLSAAATTTNWDRAIGAVPSYVTGPAAKACGSCHRAKMINEDQAGELAAFYEHTASGGYMLPNTSVPAGQPSVWEQAVTKIMAVFK